MSTREMAAGWLVRRLDRRGIHYGWVIVAVTMLVLLVASGLRSAAGVLIKPIEADFGWDRATVSLVVSVNLLIYGLAGPIAGRFTDRVGPRGVCLVSIGLMIVGTAATTLMTNLWQFHLFWGVAVGFGTGGVAMVMAASVANRWFAVQRGLVTGILGAGASAGQLIIVPLLMLITISAGWRPSVLGIGVVLGVVVLPLVVLLMRNSPTDVGAVPYGAKAGPEGEGRRPAAGAETTPIREALRTRDFWLLSGSFFVCGWTAFGTIGTHFVPHAVEHGFAEVAAAGALGLMGLLNIVGTVASGWLCDRVNARLLLAAYYGVRAVSLVMLPFVNDFTMLSVFAVLYGIDWVATVPATVMLTADRFGGNSVGSIFGWIFMIHQVGSAVASYYGGLLHVLLGDYFVAFLSAAFVAAIGAGLSLQIGSRPRRRVAMA